MHTHTHAHTRTHVNVNTDPAAIQEKLKSMTQNLEENIAKLHYQLDGCSAQEAEIETMTPLGLII